MENYEHFLDEIDKAVADGDRQGLVFLQRLAEAQKQFRWAELARAADNYLVAQKANNAALVKMYESTIHALVEEIRK